MKYWKYIIMGLLAGIMLFHFSALYYIRNQNYELTSPDYYQKELEHQDLIEAIKHGKQYQWEVSLSDDQSFLSVSVMDANGSIANLSHLTIQYLRPNDSKLDQHIHLTRQQDGHFAGELLPLAAGRWNCLIQGELQGKAIAFREKVNIP